MTSSKVCPQCRREFPMSENKSTCPSDGTVLVSNDEDLLNSTIDDKYRLVKEIGAGGWGTVYLAKHEVLGVNFAVKFLAPRLAQNIRNISRFEQEARTLARLDHEGVVKVLDFGLQPRPYIVMEYAEGQSLSEILEQRQLSPQKVLAIAVQLCTVLDYAHRNNTLHLDLTPKNVLVQHLESARPTVKLLDFGLAKLADAMVADDSRKSEAMSSLPYMSPERFSGSIGPGADIYAMGCILFECVMGRNPFNASDFSTWQQAHNRELPITRADDAKQPEPLRSVLKLAMKCLSKNPVDRPTAEMALAEIKKVEAAQSGGGAGRLSSPKPIVIGLIGLLVVGLGVWFGFNYITESNLAQQRKAQEAARTGLIDVLDPARAFTEIERKKTTVNWSSTRASIDLEILNPKGLTPSVLIIVVSRPKTRLSALPACYESWAESGAVVAVIKPAAGLLTSKETEQILAATVKRVVDENVLSSDQQIRTGVVAVEQDLEPTLMGVARKSDELDVGSVILIDPSQGKATVTANDMHNLDSPLFSIMDGNWQGQNPQRIKVSKQLDDTFTYGSGKRVLYDSARVTLRAEDGDLDQRVLKALLNGFIQVTLFDDRAKVPYLFSQKSVQAVGSSASFKMR